MTELEKIAYAKSFIDKLANGINPLDDSPIPKNDIANHIRLSRCFFFVSDVLRQVIENGEPKIKIAPKKPRKKDFSMTEEQRASIQISEIPLSIREISNYLGTIIDRETTKKLSNQAINYWLLQEGLLEAVVLPNGRHKKVPTEAGNQIGIFAEERTGQYGPYLTILLTPQAQQFLYDNLDAIIAAKEERREKKTFPPSV